MFQVAHRPTGAKNFEDSSPMLRGIRFNHERFGFGRACLGSMIAGHPALGVELEFNLGWALVLNLG